MKKLSGVQMEKFEAFEKLKEYSKNLSSVSYNEIYYLLRHGIGKIPIPLAKVKRGHCIDRARQNKGEVLFKHIDELGYIKDKDLIRNLNSFGRANNPHQVMFYGAMCTTLIPKPRLTAIAEISPLFRNSGIDCIDKEHYTISRWKIQNDFFIVEIVFSKYALDNNPEMAKSFCCQKKNLQNLNLEEKEMDFHLNFLKFISEEFSKEVSNQEEYKISVAYTNLVLSNPKVRGITYPSVATKHFGQNIVLTTEAVEKYLRPIILSTQIVSKKEEILISNGKHSCKDIDINKNIDWKESKKN